MTIQNFSQFEKVRRKKILFSESNRMRSFYFYTLLVNIQAFADPFCRISEFYRREVFQFIVLCKYLRLYKIFSALAICFSSIKRPCRASTIFTEVDIDTGLLDSPVFIFNGEFISFEAHSSILQDHMRMKLFAKSIQRVQVYLFTS